MCLVLVVMFWRLWMIYVLFFGIGDWMDDGWRKVFHPGLQSLGCHLILITSNWILVFIWLDQIQVMKFIWSFCLDIMFSLVWWTNRCILPSIVWSELFDWNRITMPFILCWNRNRSTLVGFFTGECPMDTSTLEFSLTAFGMNRRLAEIPLQKVYAEEDLFPR